jgi:hypothetical protein
MTYVFVGISFYFSAVRTWLHIRLNGAVRVLSVLLILIGIGSFFYGFTLTFVGQFFDIFGMYLLGTFILLAALVRRGSISFDAAVKLYIFLTMVLAVVQYLYPDARRWLFGLLLVPGIVLEFLPRTSSVPVKQRRPLILGFGILVVGYVFWILDQNLVLCSPNSVFQGHAAWHVLTALCGFCLAAHYSQTDDPFHPTSRVAFTTT